MVTRRWVPRVGAGAVLAAIGLSCGTSDVIVSIGGVPDTLQVVSIDVGSGTAVLSTLSLTVGDTATLSAVAFNSFNEPLGGAMVTWASTQPSVASVDGQGQVVALAPGSTTISASAQSVTANVPTTVAAVVIGPPPPPAQGALDITQGSVVLNSIGQQTQLDVTASDSLDVQTTIPPLTWASKDPSVANVNPSGLVTAVNFGATYVTVASGGYARDSVRVAVEDAAASSTVDWFCDFRHARGFSFEAVRGTATAVGTPLTECFHNRTSDSGLGSMAETVQAPSTGSQFPAEMTNVFKAILWDDFATPRSFMVQHNDGWRALQEGEYMYLRTYDRLDLAVGSSTATHILHIGNNSEANYRVWYTQSFNVVAADSGFSADVQVNQMGEGGLGEGRFTDPEKRVKAFTVNRRELRIHRVHRDSAQIQYRVYDDTNTLVATGANFVCQSSNAGACLTNGYRVDTLGAHPFYVSDWESFRSIEMGNNGASDDGSDPPVVTPWFLGGLAVRISANGNDWIGPYPVGRERN